MKRMKKYVVYDNGERANSSVAGDWDQSSFDTFDDAQTYANKWLGIATPLVVNTPYNYSEHEATIEIREEDAHLASECRFVNGNGQTYLRKEDVVRLIRTAVEQYLHSGVPDIDGVLALSDSLDKLGE